MTDPAMFFKHGKMACLRCGGVNDLGSSEALYFADDTTRCAHCGFRFIRHVLRQMAALQTVLESDPECANLLRAGRTEEIKKRLSELVPPEDEENGADHRPRG